MQTKHPCVFVHIWTDGEVGVPWNKFKPSIQYFTDHSKAYIYMCVSTVVYHMSYTWADLRMAVHIFFRILLIMKKKLVLTLDEQESYLWTRPLRHSLSLVNTLFSKLKCLLCSYASRGRAPTPRSIYTAAHTVRCGKDWILRNVCMWYLNNWPTWPCVRLNTSRP